MGSYTIEVLMRERDETDILKKEGRLWFVTLTEADDDEDTRRQRAERKRKPNVYIQRAHGAQTAALREEMRTGGRKGIDRRNVAEEVKWKRGGRGRRGSATDGQNSESE